MAKGPKVQGGRGIPLDAESVTTLAWRPDGRVLAVGTRPGAVFLLATDEGLLNVVGRLDPDGTRRGAVRCLAWDPEGRCLAAGYEGGWVQRWNASESAGLDGRQFGERPVACLAWGRGDRLAVSFNYELVAVWGPDFGQEPPRVHRLAWPAPQGLSWSMDGLCLAVAVQGGHVEILSFDGELPSVDRAEFIGPGAAVSCLLFLPDDRLVAATMGGGLFVAPNVRRRRLQFTFVATLPTPVFSLSGSRVQPWLAIQPRRGVLIAHVDDLANPFQDLPALALGETPANAPLNPREASVALLNGSGGQLEVVPFTPVGPTKPAEKPAAKARQRPSKAQEPPIPFDLKEDYADAWEALALARTTAKPLDIANGHLQMAQVLVQLGELTRALESFRQAHQAAVQASDRALQRVVLSNWAKAASRAGDTNEAVELLARANALGEEAVSPGSSLPPAQEPPPSPPHEPTPSPTPPPASPPPAPSVLTESYNPANIQDQPTAKDRLGFKPYVEAMALFLSNEQTQPPLTLSIEGEWGSGKSSFMLQLEEEIKRLDRERIAKATKEAQERVARPVLTLRFNPWRHNHDEALWAAFALQLIEEITRNGDLSRRERWRAHLSMLRRRVQDNDGLIRAWPATKLALAGVAAVATGVAGVLEAAGQIDVVAGSAKLAGVTAAVAGTAGVLGLAARAGTVVSHPYRAEIERSVAGPDYASRISFLESFHEHLNAVIDAYADGRRIYVFIDDLDRCDVPRAAELMQAINLMTAGNHSLFFVLGLDREKVAAGLAVKHKELLPFLFPAGGDGRGVDPSLAMRYGFQFIEKFIQVPFTIPRPRLQDLDQFLQSVSGLPAGARNAAAPAPGEPLVTARPAGPNGAAPSKAPSAEASEVDPAPPPPLPPSSPAPPPPVPEAPAQEQARREEEQTLFIEQAGDSDRLRRIAAAVAPLLDHNPRRLVQFMNLFRLRIAIAVTTRLITPKGQPDRITLEQLGKLVALGLVDSAVTQDLLQQRVRLADLQTEALASTSPMFGPGAVHVRVRDVLRAGLVDAGGKAQAAPHWSLEHVDAGLLLAVVPVPAAPTASAPPPSNGVLK